MLIHDNHVEVLERKITDLSDILAQLSKSAELKELLKIIKRKGWTTPAEFKLVSAVVDSMHQQAHQMTDLKTQLLLGSKMVDVKEQVLSEVR